MANEEKYNNKAIELAELLCKKNRSYGNSFINSAEILKILYPNGVGIKDYQNMLVVVRILDKLSRISHDQNAFSEDPWQDIAGYALLQLIQADI